MMFTELLIYEGIESWDFRIGLLNMDNSYLRIQEFSQGKGLDPVFYQYDPASDAQDLIIGQTLPHGIPLSNEV
jgi:hypothetical protein